MPRTSRGLELRAVLPGGQGVLVLRLGGVKEGEGKGKGAPGLGDDDVVEGGVAFAEAGKADFEDHCWVSMRGRRRGFRGRALRSV